MSNAVISSSQTGWIKCHCDHRFWRHFWSRQVVVTRKNKQSTSNVCTYITASMHCYLLEASRFSSMAEADAQETKCSKRRRRSPSSTTLYSEPQHLPHTFNLDQTTTTIKRSSRFRGVSRSFCFIVVKIGPLV